MPRVTPKSSDAADGAFNPDSPSDIENLVAAVARDTTPRPAVVFSKEMTGTGTHSGAINREVHPANPDLRYSPDVSRLRRSSVIELTSGGHLRMIPTHHTLVETQLATIEIAAEATVDRLSRTTDDPALESPFADYVTAYHRTPVPAPDKLLDISGLLTGVYPDGDPTGRGFRLFADLTPQTVTLRKSEVATDDGKTATSTSTHVFYRINLIVAAEGSCDVFGWAGHPGEHDRFLTVTDNGEDTDVFSRPMTRCLDDDGNRLFKNQADRDAVMAAAGHEINAAGDVAVYPSDDDMATVTDLSTAPLSHPDVHSFIYTAWDYDVTARLTDMITEVQNYLDPTASLPRFTGFTGASEDLWRDWSAHDYRLYNRLCGQAALLATEDMVEPMTDLIGSTFASLITLGDMPVHFDPAEPVALSAKRLTGLARQMRLLETYPIPLTAYGDLFKFINMLDVAPVVDAVVAQNMQLAMNQNLQNLADVRDELPVLALSGVTLDPLFSARQREAILASDPLTMIISGAGTGKTTTLIGHIKAMLDSGVDPRHIIALSFTNAAADTLTERLDNPQVASMTMAAMITRIYSHNFPAHQQSAIDTIINTLDIVYGEKMASNPFLEKFRHHLHTLMNDESNASMTALANFIQNHKKDTIGVLNDIKQTHLSLQLIIAYVMIDELEIPFTIPKWIIIDEVQDNSTFEFSYSLRFAAKFRSAIYLVGDASQTLYEFRAADPKALNALENSNLFDTHKLTTNYRSNQEILDFANYTLADIQANQFAQIQLQAHNLSNVDYDSFSRKVRLHSFHAESIKDIVEKIPVLFRSDDLYDYIAGNIARGEATCVVAESRKAVEAAKEALEELFPSHTVGNMTSKRVYPTTTFTKFIKAHWDEVTVAGVPAAPAIFLRKIMDHLPEIEPPKGPEEKRAGLAKMIAEKTEKNLQKWWGNNGANVTTWQSDFAAQRMTEEEFFVKFRQCIIDHENRQNAQRQQLTSEENERVKAINAKPDVLLKVSTVHGVKGLEFDNVIFICSPEPKFGLSEESKRTYYVALTRARGTEFILVAKNKTLPRIVINHEKTLANLKAKAERGDSGQVTADDIIAENTISDDVPDTGDTDNTGDSSTEQVDDRPRAASV